MTASACCTPQRAAAAFASHEVITPQMMAICTLAGFVGTNIDSVIGATIENRGFLGNAGTNLFATLGGGIFAVTLYLILAGRILS